MLIEGMFHLLVSAAPNCTKDCLCRTEPSISFSLFCFAGIVLFELLDCESLCVLCLLFIFVIGYLLAQN